MKFKDLLEVMDLKQKIVVMFNEDSVEATALEFSVITEVPEAIYLQDVLVSYIHFNPVNGKMYVYLA